MKNKMKFVIFLIFFSFIFLLLQTQNAYAWLSGFNYRRAITINNTQNSNTLTDYQVAINLTYSSNMQPDFSDIRFTNSSDSLLSYWIESKVNSAWAYVWVKVPSIPASSTATIYVYYGNTTPVSSASNGTATFILYKDFEDGTTQGFNIVYNYGSGTLTNDGTTAYEGTKSLKAYNVWAGVSGVKDKGLRIIAWVKPQQAGTSDNTYFQVGNGTSLGDNTLLLGYTSNYLYYYSGSAWTSTGIVVTSNVWYRAEILIDQNGKIVKYSVKGGNINWGIDISANNYYTTQKNIGLSFIGKGNYNTWFDLGIVANYTSPEPTYSIGAEQITSLPPQITIYSPLNQTYFYSNNFIFNFSASDDRSSTFWIKAFLDNNLIYENTSYQNNTIIILTRNLTQVKSYNFTVWANDTDTSNPQISSLTVIFTIKDFEIQQIIYNVNVYETSQQTFSEVIRYNPDLIQNITANLLWNSTNYQTLQTQNSTHFTLTSNIYIPLVQTNNTAVNFYFVNQITYTNGTTATINSQTNQQNILVAYLLNSVSFANYSTFNNINFTKYLQTNFNISCLVSNQISLGIYANSTDYRNTSFNCNGNNIYSISNNIANDGIYTIMQYLRIDFQNKTKILNGTSANFYFDNTPPTFNFTQFISIYGFSLTNMTNATIYADDVNYAKCNITLNSNSTNNTILKGNSTTIYALWNDGINTLTISCTDLVGNQNQTTSYYDVRFKKLILWEETKNRILQNFTGFTTLALKNENTGDILDLKSLANPTIYFVEPRSSNFTKLRLEFSFGNTIDTINRIIHSDLIPSETRICVHEVSTTYFTLYILSSQQTDKVGIVNTISNCYVGAGRTEYTIQNSYGLLVYTIRQNYYLYRILSETERVYLALVDGSIAQYINLDMLQYFSTKPTISFSKEHFIVSKIADKTLAISYLRTDNANAYAIVRIYNNNNLLATINANNPNDFKMYFDFSTINISSNIFYIEIETNNGKFGRYFDVSGKVGLIPEGLALVLTFGFFIFGFTLSMRLGVGILGFLTALISIIICALSIQTPTITLAEGIFVIVMIFSLLTITQESKRVV